MKRIALFGAGKSSVALIDYLAAVCQQSDWLLTVADADAGSLSKKLEGKPAVRALPLNVRQAEAWIPLISESDLVISLLPPRLHILIARACVSNGKNLLTASYIDDHIKLLQSEIEEKGLLFLCEMGLDPGIDHMSAMRLIDRIRRSGGRISLFRSHTGGLVAPESDDNPWHYKITWNARNVVRAGSAGAIYKVRGGIRQTAYRDIFAETGNISDGQGGNYAFYPNRDSLAYIPLYGLAEAETFLRTTLRHPDFCRGWKDIVAAGLTDEDRPISGSLKTVAGWAEPLMKFLDDFNKPLFEFLGLFEPAPIPAGVLTSADLLQHLIEKKWKMKASDRDQIVMLHELEYRIGGKMEHLKSSLVVRGEDAIHTAMAKTVGLPLGIAARLILENKIRLKGLRLPIIPEIYDPVLDELADHGIRFQDTVS